MPVIPPLQGMPSTAAGLTDTVPTEAGRSGQRTLAVAPSLLNIGSNAANTVKLTPQALLHLLEPQLLDLPEGAPGAGASPIPWPAQGASVPEHAWAAQLLKALPAPWPSFQLVSLQHWPLALLKQFLRQAAEPAPAPVPALQTAATQAAQVHTATGVQGLQLALLVPSEDLATVTKSSPQGTPATAGFTPVFRLADKAWLGTGVMAMVLQHGEEPPISALLMLELGPVRETLVYGREALMRPVDPWLQQAQYLANAQPRQPREPSGPLCLVDTCPYAGRAACPQPFCTTLAAVARPAL